MSDLVPGNSLPIGPTDSVTIKGCDKIFGKSVQASFLEVYERTVLKYRSATLIVRPVETGNQLAGANEIVAMKSNAGSRMLGFVWQM